MSGTTWSKFYWSDWESDPALRLCSLAAQGLWMRMLCIASYHDPIGYVAVAGRGLDETALARMTGCSESEAAALLGELDRNGVFSRDRQSRIYSRRMVADAKRAATARKNGKSGGNPTLQKQKGNSDWDNPEDKARLKTQEPDTRVQKDSLGACAPPDEPFEKFWEAYPKRDGGNPRKPAKQKFEHALKRGIPAETIISAAGAYAAERGRPGEDPRFTAQAVTWLGQERWADKPAEVNRSPPSDDDRQWREFQAITGGRAG